MQAKDVLNAYTTFCRDGELECSVELKNVDIGIRGATQVALIKIIKENWDTIVVKAKKKEREISRLLSRQ